jgi:hypothetical protein
VFERFTDRARRVLVLAQHEARLLDQSFIGTEHILLGLIQEGEGVAAKALESLDISYDAVREKIQEAIGAAGGAPSGSPPFTPRAKKVLELSLRESMQFGHSYIGTEHMLLGLVREGEGVAATVLVNLGASLGSVRRTTISLMAGHDPLGPGYLEMENEPSATSEWAPPVWDRPSEGAIPAVLVVDAPLLQNEFVALAVEHLEVYSNGFVISLLMRVNPRLSNVGGVMEMLGAAGPNRWPQVGVRFADGSTARPGPGVGGWPELAKDEHGVPIEPIVCMRGGGGGVGGWRAWAWVFPLPSDQPFEILLAFPAVGLPESSVWIDGAAVRAAAERAKDAWI